MPSLYLDSEQADLIEAACAMLEAALTARVKRADPEKVISNSLQLQAHKLSTVRAQLAAGEPPPWHALNESLKSRALALMSDLAQGKDQTSKEHAWRALRALVNAPHLPTA